MRNCAAADSASITDYVIVTVGKAIRKLVMVTSLLFGKAVVVAAKSTITKIQAIENRVYKYLMGLCEYTTIAALTA